MPLVRISVEQGTTPEYRKALSDGVHRALVEAMQVPPDDRFHVISEYAPGGIVYAPKYLGIEHSGRIVFVQVTLSTGRKPQQKRAVYRRIADIPQRPPPLPPKGRSINPVQVP